MPEGFKSSNSVNHSSSLLLKNPIIYAYKLKAWQHGQQGAASTHT